MISKTEPLVTVIIPIYNSEKYLENLLISVLSQTYSNLEILLINDGSTDSSINILKNFSEKDSRISIIDKENTGVSDCRNIGIQKSTGEYIAFIDSDDIVSCDYIFCLMQPILKYNAEISICNYLDFKDSVPENFSTNCNESNKISNMTVLKELYGTESIKYTVPWCKIISKKLFENILFPIGKIHEDVIVMHKLFFKDAIIYDTNNILYLYRRHNQSITSSSNKINNMYADIKRCIDLHEYLKNKNEESFSNFILFKLQKHFLYLMLKRQKIYTQDYSYFSSEIKNKEKYYSVIKRMIIFSSKFLYYFYKKNTI